MGGWWSLLLVERRGTAHMGGAGCGLPRRTPAPRRGTGAPLRSPPCLCRWLCGLLAQAYSPGCRRVCPNCGGRRAGHVRVARGSGCGCSGCCGERTVAARTAVSCAPLCERAGWRWRAVSGPGARVQPLLLVPRSLHECHGPGSRTGRGEGRASRASAVWSIPQTSLAAPSHSWRNQQAPPKLHFPSMKLRHLAPLPLRRSCSVPFFPWP